MSVVSVSFKVSESIRVPGSITGNGKRLAIVSNGDVESVESNSKKRKVVHIDAEIDKGKFTLYIVGFYNIFLIE